MKKETWKKRIKAACEQAGTYRESFESVIDTLATILEVRDEAVNQYALSGGNPVVVHVNKGGFSNVVKNPALTIITEMNQQALTYWRELGLTPKSLRAIDQRALKSSQRKNTLGDALKDLGI